jgi:hypothetical protein
MKLNLTKNRIAKILSLLLAIAIWFLIKNNLAESARLFDKPPPRAIPVREK